MIAGQPTSSGDENMLVGRFADLGSDGRPARLGIMGGTFDPIHLGHLLCAERAREAFSLDAVLFMPAGDPSFKQGTVKASPMQRLEMTQMATADNPFFDVSALEVMREGTTYTVDTLTTLREMFPPNVSFYFITGSDALRTITKWYRFDEMRSLATFIGVSRPGYTFDEAPMQGVRFDVRLLEIDALAISSSDIRERIAGSKTIRYLTKDEVVDYIRRNGLYGSGRDAASESTRKTVYGT